MEGVQKGGIKSPFAFLLTPKFIVPYWPTKQASQSRVSLVHSFVLGMTSAALTW